MIREKVTVTLRRINRGLSAISRLAMVGGPFARSGYLRGMETFPDDRADDCSDDCAGHEIGKPVDGYRNSQANVQRPGDGEDSNPLLPWEQPEDGDRHRERHGGMRRRPAPENSAAHESEMENMADVVAARTD